MIYNNEERIGVYSIAKIFEEKFRWIFREQPINDFGIDGFVEITRIGLNLKDIIPIGRLIGVQIKSGKSFFKEVKDDCIVFRGSQKHLGYWLNFTTPVILVVYDKEINTAYWEQVNHSTIILTGKSFKVNIPKKNVLDYTSKERLTSVGFFKNRYQYKLWQIQTSIEEIKLLTEKQLFLYIEIDSIPKVDDYHITLLLTDENSENTFEIIHLYHDENPNRFEYHFYLSKNKSLKEAINDALPWTNLSFEGADFTDELLAEQVAGEILSYNEKEFIEDVLELKEGNSFLKLACYLTGSYFFKLELKINELTHTFLTINEFLSKEPIMKQRIFL